MIKLFFHFIPFIFIGCQTNIAYWPNKNTPILDDQFSKTYTEVKTKTKENFELTHWYAKKGRPIILVFHSNAGNIQYRWYSFFNKKTKNRISKYNFLISAGYSVFIASYRGYGNNPGVPNEKNIIEDSRLIMEWLMKNEKISSKDIILFGESLGSAVSIALAVHYPIKGLILEGAPSSFPDVGEDLFPFLPIKKTLNENTWNSQSRIQKVLSPVLFLHREKDYMVSFHLGKKLFESANEPKHLLILKGRGHINTLKENHIQQAVLQFISNPQSFLSESSKSSK